MSRSRTTFLTFLNKGVLSLINFINSVLTARYFQAVRVDRLEFQFTSSISNTGMTFLGGYNGYISYALARRPEDAVRTVQMGNLFLFLASLLIWLVTLGLRVALGPAFHAWMWAGVAMPFCFMVNYATRLLQGMNEISWLNRLNMAQPLVFLLLYLPLFLAGRVPLAQRLPVTYAAWTLSFVAAAAGGLWIGYRTIRRNAVWQWRFWREQWRGILGYGQWLSISNLVNYANYRMDFWLVAAFIPGNRAADYTIAVVASEVLLNISQSITSVVYTRMSAASRREAVAITEVSTRQALLSSALVAVLMYIVFPWLIPAAFGRAWAGALPPFYVLLPGLVFKAASQVLLQFYTNQLGRPQTTIVMNGSSAVINAILCCILLPTIGMMGGAIASTGSYVLSFFGYVWWFCRGNQVGPSGLLRIRASDFEPYRVVLNDFFGFGRRR
ncbi:MAG: oligosaccharide flippase family protein [Alicyclobacillus sp.]|nr:oligosaccharide flippase family protein [Alicyclobacillus sp.]